MYQLYTNIFFAYKTNKYINWSILFGLYFIYMKYSNEYILYYLLPYESFIRYGLCWCQLCYCINTSKSLVIFNNSV